MRSSPTHIRPVAAATSARKAWTGRTSSRISARRWGHRDDPGREKPRKKLAAERAYGAHGPSGWSPKVLVSSNNLCTPNDRRSGFFSKTFHRWFVCCVPPLINPKPVVRLGPAQRQICDQPRPQRFQSVGRLVRQGSPSALSTSSKVRRPQFAAAGREAASRVHYATHSAAWHTYAWGAMRGIGCDWGWVDCRRGCRATSLFRSVGKGGEGRREGERGKGGGRGRGRGKKG